MLRVASLLKVYFTSKTLMEENEEDVKIFKKPDNEALNSKLASEILGYLAEEESYSKELAEKMDRNSSLVSRTINQMNKLGIVEKSRRSKAQYYKISYDGIAEHISENLIGSDEENFFAYNQKDKIQRLIKITFEELLSFDNFIEWLKRDPPPLHTLIFETPHDLFTNYVVSSDETKDEEFLVKLINELKWFTSTNVYQVNTDLADKIIEKNQKD